MNYGAICCGKKYKVLNCGDCVKSITNDSSLWCDIASSTPGMIETGRWIIGDGKMVAAWEDNWLGEEYCLSNYIVIVPRNHNGPRVCDLINECGEWNMIIIENWLPKHWIDKLKTCLPPSMGQGFDVFCFIGTNNDKFSIKDMFNELEGYNFDMADRDWVNIWKVVVPERYKTFVWLLKHDKLLTNESKSKKALGNASCKMCGYVSENTLHEVRDHSKSMQVWKSLVPSNLLGEFYKVDVRNWIMINLNYKGIADNGWSNIWIIACHALWTWRNMEEHNANYARPLDPISHIFTCVRDYRTSTQLYKILKVEGDGNKYKGWKPSISNMIKLNTDGARKSDNVVGC